MYFVAHLFLRNLEAVDFDVDRFMKDMESVMGHQVSEDASSNLDIEEGSSSDSDMDFGNFFSLISS